MKKTIGIRAFLGEIDQYIQSDVPYTFSIEFVKKGKSKEDPERGKIKKLERACKSYKPKKIQTQNQNKKEFYRIKEQGVLLLYDTQTQETLSVVIDLITKYNDYIIIH